MISLNIFMKFSKIDKSVFIKITIFIVTITLVALVVTPVAISPEFKNFVKAMGLFGPIFVMAALVLSHIVAPLSGTPSIVVSITTFGIYKAMIYIYLAGLVSATINFYISRLFGRKIVTKLIGKKTIEEVDNFVDSFGTQFLIISRIFGFSIFELISYAAGLTKISFKKYFFITAVFSLVPTIVFTFIFRNADFNSKSNIYIWVGSIFIAGIIFAFFIRSYIKKK